MTMPDPNTLETIALPAPLRSPAAIRAEADDPRLDNPIWNALSTDHLSLAEGDERARRYPAAIGPLSGIPNDAPENFEALRRLAGPDAVVVLFCCREPAVPPGWTLIRGGQLAQMVCLSPSGTAATGLLEGASLRPLDREDVPAMVALAELTEPGPFRNRTIELGGFYGIFEDNRLQAMAGQRMQLPHHAEVSAVCTHPDARGRGYARLLMSKVMEDICVGGKTPFLHTFADNHPAIRVYESLGYSVRCTFHLAVLKNEA